MRAPAAGASCAAAWARSRRRSPPSGREKGLEIRTDAEVAAIDNAGGRATGVTLADGTRFEAQVVASNVSAKLTFLKFLATRPAAGRFRARRRGVPDLFRRPSRSTSPASGCRNTRLQAGRGRLRLSHLHPCRPDHRVSRAGLRRRQVRRHVARALRHAGHAELCRRHASRRPASTSSTCSAAMRPIR